MTAIIGTTVVLATFAVVALAGAAAVAPWIRRIVRRQSHPAGRARLLLAAQAGPALAALAIALGVVLPAFVRFEPANAAERPGTVLLALAATGAFLLLVSAESLARALAYTRHVRRTWLAGAQPVHVAGGRIRAFCIVAPFPIVAVVGVVRPLLFIARSVVETCSPDELEAIVAHEAAHIGNRDNLKRLLIRAAGSAWTCAPGSASLVAAWTRAAEEAADDWATVGSPRLRLELASALVRVARLATLPAPPAALHVSALFTGPVETRIRRLVAAGMSVDAGSARSRTARTAALVGGAAVVAATIGALPAVHAGIEALVRVLP